MGRSKMTVTIDASLIGVLDRLSHERKESRSRIVEEAIRSWQRSRIKEELIEGYRAMAKEDVETAEDHLSAGFKTLA